MMPMVPSLGSLSTICSLKMYWKLSPTASIVPL
jgi:hypothetical protein